MTLGKVVLTGDRPTGKLHLGHFVGSLKSRVELQDNCKQYVMIADLQALTHNVNNASELVENTYGIMVDYLSAGLDPNKTTFLVQSSVHSLHEIVSYYMNLVTISRLHRNPTIKQEIHDKGYEDSVPAGFFCHPVSQAADITAFQADLVPVGEDQKPLIEQCNEIVRKFSSLYGDGIVKEAEPVLSHVPRLLGIDGKAKASKSMNNAIFLSDDTDAVKEKVYAMYTDPDHIKVTDPGKVEGNIVFHYLDAFYEDKSHLEQLKQDYRKGGLGDVELKKLLFATIEGVLAPMRERRASVGKNQPREILVEGTRKAAQVADATVLRMREAVGLFRCD